MEITTTNKDGKLVSAEIEWSWKDFTAMVMVALHNRDHELAKQFGRELKRMEAVVGQRGTSGCGC